MNIKININLNKSQKILLVLYKLSKGTNKQIRFEDIAVTAYQNFKGDFQLKGYPQYPDTGDIIHKPLYSELKKNGYVLSGNKFFSLTKKGIEYAERLLKNTSNIPLDQNKNYVKFTASQGMELQRIKDSAAFIMYSEGKKDEILDIDFYSYLGVTVRTNKFDFLGRLNTVEDAINATKDKNGALYQQLKNCHSFLMDRFKENINFVNKSKGGKR